MKKYIVKVQLSLATFPPTPTRRALIYTKGRTLEWDGDATPEIVKRMGDASKAFFAAHLDAGNRFVLDRRVDDQGW